MQAQYIVSKKKSPFDRIVATSIIGISNIEYFEKSLSMKYDNNGRANDIASPIPKQE